MRRLCNVREAEEQLNRWILAQSSGDWQLMAKHPETPSHALTEGSRSNNTGAWKLAMTRTQGLAGRRDFSLNLRWTYRTVSSFCRQKRHIAGKVSKTAQSAPGVTTSATKKRQLVIVVNSFLRGTEAPNLLLRKVCYLLRVHIRDVMKRLTNLIQPRNYYPLLFFLVGTRTQVQPGVVWGVSRGITEPWKHQ